MSPPDSTPASVVATDCSTQPARCVERPGLGMPLDAYLDSTDMFPSALVIDSNEWRANTIGIRERAMLWFIDFVTDKPGWNTAVFDDDAVAQWREEAREAACLCEIEVAAAKEAKEARIDAKAAMRKARREARLGHPTSESLLDYSSDDTDNEDVSHLDRMQQRSRYFAGTATKHMERAYTPPLARGFSDAMFDFCIRELRDKAEIYDATGIVSVYDGAAAVFKSDAAVSPEVHAELVVAVKSLEDSLPRDEAIRPGTGGCVRDLIDPSMYPLVYGKTRALRDRTITRDTCLQAYASGAVVPVPTLRPAQDYVSSDRLLSTKFQWLPCEVDIAGGKARITSYINNLHPLQHADVYRAAEEVLTAALPMFGAMYDRVMTWDSRWYRTRRARVQSPTDLMDVMSRSRVLFQKLERRCCDPDTCKDPENDPERGCGRFNHPDARYNARVNRQVSEMWESHRNNRDGLDEDLLESLVDSQKPQRPINLWFERTHPFVQPEPREYEFVGCGDYKLSGPWFERKGGDPESFPDHVQVIVKLTNIELTPDNPTYPGGHWHVEGVLNERICGTALYYYDIDNITESRLAFRTFANAEDIHENIKHMVRDPAEFETFYDFSPRYDGPTLINMGSVRAQQGRLLVFPNVYQHRIEPFELADKTRPGHRKILAIFLVDPHRPVVSTANVPPQQRHWARMAGIDTVLPREIANEIYDDLGCPYDVTEARALREEMAKERSGLDATSATLIKSTACCRAD